MESSAILAIDYDAEAARLEVRFASGILYTYADVPAAAFAALLAAPSKGEHFNAHVRGRYAFARVGR